MSKSFVFKQTAVPSSNEKLQSYSSPLEGTNESSGDELAGKRDI